MTPLTSTLGSQVHHLSSGTPWKTEGTWEPQPRHACLAVECVSVLKHDGCKVSSVSYETVSEILVNEANGGVDVTEGTAAISRCGGGFGGDKDLDARAACETFSSQYGNLQQVEQVALIHILVEVGREFEE